MFGLVIRVLVTLAVFALILRSVDLPSVADYLRRTDPLWLLAAVLLQFCGTLVASVRWYWVMQPLGFGQRPFFYVRSYYKGMFFNQALPTSIGGDALRVLDVAGLGYRKSEAFYGVAVDRGIGLFTLLLLNLLAFGVNPRLLPAQAAYPIAGIALAGVVGFVVFHQVRHLHALGRLRGIRMVRELSEHLARVLRSWGAVALHVAVGMAVHVFTVLALFCLGRAVGLNFDLATYMIIVPPVILLTVVPISLAGWGVREGAMIGLFLLLGADQAAVLSMSILYGVVLIVISLPGLYVYLRGRRRRGEEGT